jgi:hypothetical protein
MTELQAINQMLAAVGQMPVTSIDLDQSDNPTNPDVAMAQETLNQVSREVQAEGWTFNREFNYPFIPDTNNEIIIAPNVLQIDLCREVYSNLSKDPIRRVDPDDNKPKLYDKTAHTYKWSGTVSCDVLWLFDWDELPPPILDYIMNRASAVFSQRIIGNMEQYQILTAKAEECRAYALEYETQQGDYTFFGHPQGGNYYQSYKPFHALYR